MSIGTAHEAGELVTRDEWERRLRASYPSMARDEVDLILHTVPEDIEFIHTHLRPAE